MNSVCIKQIDQSYKSVRSHFNLESLSHSLSSYFVTSEDIQFSDGSRADASGRPFSNVILRRQLCLIERSLSDSTTSLPAKSNLIFRYNINCFHGNTSTTLNQGRLIGGLASWLTSWLTSWLASWASSGGTVTWFCFAVQTHLIMNPFLVVRHPGEDLW